jgi:16S rRNA (adenine1518-N6/adenine1519-N6)-dimethyltransferase
LREAGLHARKSLGQHFLSDRRVLRRIVAAADSQAGDTVVEVGPGLGALTAELAAEGARVVAVEIDERLCDYLRRRFADSPGVSVLCADVLSRSPRALLAEAGASPPYLVVANLPYYVAAPVLRHFLESSAQPERMVVMLQREVAESVVAGPGRMSLLGVSVQLYGEPRLLFAVPPSAFYPRPKVTSAVVRVDVAPRLRADVDDVQRFFRIVRAGFSAPRKQLRNALALGLGLDTVGAASLLALAGIDPRLRAQELSLEQWAALARTLPGGVDLGEQRG